MLLELLLVVVVVVFVEHGNAECRTWGGHVTRPVNGTFHACKARSARRLLTISPVCCQYALASDPAAVSAGNSTAWTQQEDVDESELGT